jgi:hypothetical protein
LALSDASLVLVSHWMSESSVGVGRGCFVLIDCRIFVIALDRNSNTPRAFMQPVSEIGFARATLAAIATRSKFCLQKQFNSFSRQSTQRRRAKTPRVIDLHPHGGFMEEFEFAKRLCDDELVRHFTQCVRDERQVTARLLVQMGEIEARGLYREIGYESMFDYAVHGLHMSDSEAGLRLYVARLGRTHPVALEMLSRGQLHLTALRLLAPVLSTTTPSY